MRHILLASFAILWLSLPPGVTAQAADPSPQVRIRVTVDSRHYTGSWGAIATDSLSLIQGSTTRTFPRRDILLVERAAGRHGAAGKGALIGALSGGGVGLVAGLADASSCSSWCFGAAAEGSGGFLFGALVGGLLGAGIGAVAGETRWVPTDLPAPVTRRMTLRPVLSPSARGLRLGLRLEF